ncbi:MAG: serine hydrolase [Balneolaceae bacterium]|nr:serine hydrolase [Balneolaceae bacterium]MBO6547040.1 serine hydrolase [Balneolaceae bacterium]MBO6648013.1 serine hydrolase [Balneolaceae bacterium]
MKKLQILGFLLFALISFSGSENLPEKFTSELVSPPNESFIDSLVANATLREKIGQLFFVPVEGSYLNQDSHRFKEISDLITQDHIGGIIFMRGDIYGQAVLTNKLQKLSRIPLWITQDMEYGAAMRISGSTRFTPAMGVAASGNKRNAFMMGKITAIEAKALGVHQVFAPVLDVNNNPDNPVINVRAFSGDPKMVSEYGVAFMQGVHSEGVVSTAKHFPGHGDTDTDSHNELPILDHDYSRLDSVELIPFKAAIEGGMQSVMSAHISFPQISDHPELPGTLDESILSGILKDSLNFDGVVVTDGLEMEGIASKFSPGRVVVRALHAGADIMLISPDIYTAINEVVAAVERGEITEERINESYRKIIQWKEENGLFDKSNQVDITHLDTRINTNFHQSVANNIARESITLLKNDGDILPIDPTVHKKVLLVSISDDDYGNTGGRFARSIRDYHPDVTFEVHDTRSDTRDENEILKKAREADLVIIGSYISLSFRESIQLSRQQSAFLRKLTQVNKPTVLVMFGNPYLVTELTDTDVHIMAWANTTLQMENAGPALFGASAITGKLPIRIPGMYEIGDGIEIRHTSLRYGKPEEVGLVSKQLYKIDDILRDAVRDSVFPGAVAAVVKDGVMVYRKEVGYHDYDKLKQVKDSDVYDLASITKVVSTTTAVMKLVDENKLALDDEVRKFIPEFDTNEKRHITIRDMLLHQSGLPPFRVYVDSLKDRASIIRAVKNEPLTYETGTDYVYSDLGMILLAEIVSLVADQGIDGYMRKEFYYPMGMYGAYFNPRKVSRWYVNRIPPTEIDTVYMRGLVQANVHDERAYFLDGVAGHAGLFATTDDLAKYSTMLLNDGVYAGKRYLSSEIIKEFTTQQSDLSGRGLGFDRKSPEGFTTAGQLSSTDTFGHLGFTGTSIWIDREKNMAVILLTNRTYPNRSYGRRISRIRAAVADAAFSAFIKP